MIYTYIVSNYLYRFHNDNDINNLQFVKNLLLLMQLMSHPITSPEISHQK